MKKLIALMTTAVLAASFTTSCQLMHHPYDEDNAQKLAIEYMKEKYDKEIEVTDIYCQKHGSDKYVGVKFKLDETDNESSDDSTYEVRVYGNKDTQYQYVKCDNYMNTLFEPIFKLKIEEFLNKNQIDEYVLNLSDLHQIGAKDTTYYLSDFSIPDKELKIEDVLKEYDLWFYCWIYLPETHYNNAQNIIETNFEPLIYNDDIVNFWIYTYTDFDYQKYKEAKLINKSDFSITELSPVKEIKITLKKEEN